MIISGVGVGVGVFSAGTDVGVAVGSCGAEVGVGSFGACPEPAEGFEFPFD